jgi:DNA-binding transcriptional MerR regulator
VQLTGMRYSTLKYYTEEGMIPFHQEESRLTRRYDRIKAVQRIDQIKALKETGLSVTQIKQHLNIQKE